MIVAAVVVAAGLGACTGERAEFADGPDATLPMTTTTRPPRPGTVVVDRWADGFCATFERWQADAAAIGDEVADDLAATSDPETVRDSLVDLLERVASRTDEFAEAVTDGEVPDVEDGPTLVSALGDRFEDLADTFRTQRDLARDIDVEDPDRFQEDVDAVVEAMRAGQTEIAESFEAIDRDFPDRSLQLALRQSCAAG